MHLFTQPVSMQVTQKQYDKDLKEPLKILGYKINKGMCFTHFCTNANNKNNEL